jgi:signal transduction histidine kinase
MRSRVLLCLVVAAGLLLQSLVVAEPSQRSVLVLDQSSAFLPFNATVANAIRATVNADSRWRISFYSEHLDANRFFGPDYENDFVQFLKAKYRNRPIDVVVVFGISALDFMVRRRDEIWPSVPVVFAAIDEATIASLTLPKNVTGATMQLTLQDMVKVARMVVPDLKAVAMVGDPLERQTFYRHFKDEIPAVAAQYEIIDLMDLPLAELKTRLGSLPDTTAVIYTGIYYTTEGISYVPAELTSQIAEWANRPVVINVSSYLNKGAVGGYIVQATPIGQQAGRLALRILGGENASDLPVVKVPSQLIFEWPALQRWKVSESALPPGSSVQFRRLTLWEEHRAIVLAAVFGLIAQAAMIFWLLYERQRRHAAEVAARRTMTELAHMNRIATAGEMTASIAHEIRQPLGAIMTNGQAALRWLKRQVPDIEEAKTAVQDLIQETARANEVITNIRAMFKKEDTPRVVLDVNQLIEQVLVPTKQTISSKNVAVQLNLTDEPRRLVLGDPIQLQQVVLNLINNAVEAMSHPGLTRILRLQTEVDHSARMVLVRVIDSGPRVDPKLVEKMFQPFFTTKSSGMGIGLSICKTIIEAHGGQLTASANNPHGMEFQIILPLHQRGADEDLK